MQGSIKSEGEKFRNKLAMKRIMSSFINIYGVGCESGCGKVLLPYQGGKKVNPPGMFLAVKYSEVSQGARGSLGVHFG